VIEEVFEHSPAFRAGDAFRPSRIIRAIDGKAIRNAADYALALDRAGSSMAVTVVDPRTENSETWTITLADPAKAPKASGCRLQVSSAVWRKKGLTFLPDYRAALKAGGASDLPLDFSQRRSAAREINAWVREQTNGKITSVVAADSLRTDTSLLFTN